MNCSISSALIFVCLVNLARCAPMKVSSEQNAERLRNMFEQSHTQAIRNFYEQKAMQAMLAGFKAKNNGGNQSLSSAYAIPIILDGSTNHSADNVIDLDDSNSTKIGVAEANGLPILKKNNTINHLHNDARQSSMFPSFGSQSFMNPMNNLLRPPSLPTLPSLSTFQMPTPSYRPPPPPKTSIIGNGGGPMALTNDNVVVVNVMSGNW